MRVGCLPARKGPIPACAGQPPLYSSRRWSVRAYPRVCGATGVADLRSKGFQGLSPRVRGNPRHSLIVFSTGGPIPACAGQPFAEAINSAISTAYPRVCGATFDVIAWDHEGQGLSPRVRGNPRFNPYDPPPPGPIPACAGQPNPNVLMPRRLGAYPRVCGATDDDRLAFCPLKGLSPRVRGNRDWSPCGTPRVRPIPACAGQPATSARLTRQRRAYPRVCGATAATSSAGVPMRGLSPRVRGNRQQQGFGRCLQGPIPACAGQPKRRATGLWR